jgi:hypothetical protein
LAATPDGQLEGNKEVFLLSVAREASGRRSLLLSAVGLLTGAGSALAETQTFKCTA